MTQAASFPYTTARFALPVLFAGQAQKEFTVNEALSRIDMLLHPSIAGLLSAPPATPEEGDCFLVASGATGEFAGRENAVAGWDGQQWSFIAPQAGMRVYDEQTGAWLQFDGSWQSIPAPTVPAGGGVVDAEARATLSQLIDCLRQAGIFL